MEFAESLSLALRWGLVGLFFVYYSVALGLSTRLRQSPARALILRGAVIPVLVAGLICVTYLWFHTARGREVSAAFFVVTAACVVGAIGFTLWLQRGGGKQMLYVPIAFARSGWAQQDEATYAVADLSSDEPRIGSSLLLSFLPAVIVLLTMLLVLWDTSRSVGS